MSGPNDPPPTSPSPLSAHDEALVIGYVEAALETLEGAADQDVEALCADHPHLAPAVRRALGMAGAMDALHQQARESEPQADRLLGDRYRIESTLGSGAMGTVFSAMDTRLERRIAIKVLRREWATPLVTDDGQDQPNSSDSVALQRFQQEARLLAKLQHPSIVAVHDSGVDDDTAYLVMERIEGPSLAEVLDTATRAMPNGPDLATMARRTEWLSAAPKAGGSHYVHCVVQWGAELAEALHTAHRAGVVHRDVKPSNTLLRENGRACLLDFGIATLRSAAGAAWTAAGTSIGTPYYMAPEQVQATDPRVRRPDGAVHPGGDAAELTPATDVYGLCATLYHLLSLQPLFDGDVPTVLTSIATRDAPSLRSAFPAAPRDLAAIVDHGLERRPQDRYPTAQALAGDLRAFLEYRPVTARPVHAIGRWIRRARRRPWKAAAWIAAIVLIGSLAIAMGTIARQDAAIEARVRTEKAADVRAHLPALLALEAYPTGRAVEFRAAQSKVEAELRELLALDPQDHATRLLLISLRIDDGQHAAAAAECETLAQRSDSNYLRILAQRYRTANRDTAGVASLDLANLPEPQSPIDHFVAGFHALRHRTKASGTTAEQHLLAAGPEYAPARDLLLPVFLLRAEQTRGPERQQYVQRCYDEALRLEGVYGRPTARTRHALGTALVLQRRYGDAIPFLKDALRLRPGRHGPLQNLAICQYRLGDLAAARKSLARAHALRPELWNTLHTMARVACAEDRFDDALRAAERIPRDGILGESWRRPHVIAGVHLDAAFAHYRGGRLEAAKASAKQARLHYDAFASARGIRTPTRGHLLAQSIEEGEFVGVLRRFVHLQLRDPQNAIQLGNIARMLPEEGLDRPALQAVRTLLLGLAVHFAPDHPQLGAALDEARDALNRPVERSTTPPNDSSGPGQSTTRPEKSR